jgi:hypothetical protein
MEKSKLLEFSGNISYSKGWVKDENDEKQFNIVFNLPSNQLEAYNLMQVLYGIESKITFKTDEKEISFIGKIKASSSSRKPEGWRVLIGLEGEQVDGFKETIDMLGYPINAKLEILE